MEVRHIKITSSEGLYRINDKKAFKSLVVSLQPKCDILDQTKSVESLQLCITSSFISLKSHLTTTSLLLLPMLGPDQVLSGEIFEGVL